jgi:cell division septation protein DedD
MLAKLDQERAAAAPQQAAVPDAEPPPQPAASNAEPPPQPEPAAPAAAPASPPAAAKPAVETAVATAAAPSVQQPEPAAVAPAAPAGIHLWLGSLPSPEGAEKQWKQMRESFADLFQAMEMQVAEVERDQRKFYRLLAGPVADRNRGKEICRQLQERDPEAWCKVVGGP